MSERDRVVVMKTGNFYETYNPLTEREEVAYEYEVLEVEGDPVLEYFGFRLQYVRNMGLLHSHQLNLLRSQGVEVDAKLQFRDEDLAYMEDARH